MTFRLKSFAEIGLQTPALYLDTDMLVVQPIDPAALLGDCDVAVCGREYGRMSPFNTSLSFGGLDLSEYSGKTLGEVYPYLACTTATRDNAFWRDCLDNLNELDAKFHIWYGDQEAMRNVLDSGRYRFLTLSESVFGYLPGEKPDTSSPSKIYHFKGQARKNLMAPYAHHLGLIADPRNPHR